MPSVFERFQNAWNAFTNKAPVVDSGRAYTGAYSYGYRPDRPRFTRGNQKTIVAPVLNKIAIDVAAINYRHVKLDESGRYLEDLDTGLNNCLTLSANADQTSRAFMQDVAMSLFDEGSIAIIPVDTIGNPLLSKSYDIVTLRTGKILQWYPDKIKARVYNERIGKYEEIFVPKYMAAIVENPFYSVMNEPTSTLRRLIHKMALLDAVDDQTSSGKLDLIVQLPYAVKTEARRKQANERRKEIETQLTGTKYGIAYTDGTEKIVQLNRSVENNLLDQVNKLQDEFYSQMGMTPEIFNGTADEAAMLNYMNRTIEPIAAAIVDEMNRKFLTKTARSQHQAVRYYTDPFKLVPVNQLAEIADKFTRNEILTSNEIRQIVGIAPSADPMSDVLRNSNVSMAAGQQLYDVYGQPVNQQSNLLNPPMDQMDPTAQGGAPPEQYNNAEPAVQ